MLMQQVMEAFENASTKRMAPNEPLNPLDTNITYGEKKHFLLRIEAKLERKSKRKLEY
ncbi:MAG: hypothetical protein RAK17_02910 [Caldisphaera sp.]|nr:hypothetical protein [Caldisphaera sp.]